MAGHNRHLRGETNEVLGNVHGNVVVEAGDLMFKDTIDGVRGAGVADDSYVYPFNLAVNSASAGTQIINAIYTQFCGVAMEGSPSGTTEAITVATSGVFRYPNYTVAGVTIGSLVSAVSPFSSASGVSEQTVAITGADASCTAYLGYCVKTESGASFIDLQIRTAYGPGGLAS